MRLVEAHITHAEPETVPAELADVVVFDSHRWRLDRTNPETAARDVRERFDTWRAQHENWWRLGDGDEFHDIAELTDEPGWAELATGSQQIAPHEANGFAGLIDDLIDVCDNGTIGGWALVGDNGVVVRGRTRMLCRLGDDEVRFGPGGLRVGGQVCRGWLLAADGTIELDTGTVLDPLTGAALVLAVPGAARVEVQPRSLSRDWGDMARVLRRALTSAVIAGSILTIDSI